MISLFPRASTTELPSQTLHHFLTCPLAGDLSTSYCHRKGNQSWSLLGWYMGTFSPFSQGNLSVSWGATQAIWAGGREWRVQKGGSTPSVRGTSLSWANRHKFVHTTSLHGLQSCSCGWKSTNETSCTCTNSCCLQTREHHHPPWSPAQTHSIIQQFRDRLIFLFTEVKENNCLQLHGVLYSYSEFNTTITASTYFLAPPDRKGESDNLTPDSWHGPPLSTASSEDLFESGWALRQPQWRSNHCVYCWVKTQEGTREEKLFD